MKPEKGEARRLREDYALREELRERLDRYMDLPLALASILLVLLAIIQLRGEVSEPWRSRPCPGRSAWRRRRDRKASPDKRLRNLPGA